MVIRFFRLPASAVDDGRDALLIPENDILPLDSLKHIRVIHREGDHVIINAVITDDVIQAQGQYSEAEPLSLKALMELGIAELWCGNSYTDNGPDHPDGPGLYWFRPDLAPEWVKDPESGEMVRQTKVVETKWSFE